MNVLLVFYCVTLIVICQSSLVNGTYRKCKRGHGDVIYVHNLYYMLYDH